MAAQEIEIVVWLAVELPEEGDGSGMDVDRAADEISEEIAAAVSRCRRVYDESVSVVDWTSRANR